MTSHAAIRQSILQLVPLVFVLFLIAAIGYVRNVNHQPKKEISLMPVQLIQEKNNEDPISSTVSSTQEEVSVNNEYQLVSNKVIVNDLLKGILLEYSVSQKIPSNWKVKFDSRHEPINQVDESILVAPMLYKYPWWDRFYSSDPQIGVSDITNWLKNDKQEMYGSTISLSAREKRINLCKFAGFHKKRIKNADGSLSGSIAIVFSTQSFEPTPYVLFCMSGIRNRRNIKVSGMFYLKDKLVTQIEQLGQGPEYNQAVRRAISEYKMKLPTDTQQQFQEIQSIVESIQVSVKE